ncbi:hypothetical protein [Streptomyces sp. NPDC059008]|uniref:hypothetical protein n=1 Tax=Streptomyces sp. NPDC059008 TaxID=3346693 RepID=UPI003675FA64
MAEVTQYINVTPAARVRVLETAIEPPALEIGNETIILPPADSAQAAAFFEELKNAAEEAQRRARRRFIGSMGWEAVL